MYESQMCSHRITYSLMTSEPSIKVCSSVREAERDRDRDRGRQGQGQRPFRVGGERERVHTFLCAGEAVQ
jgi:hypothetical protein